MYFTKKCKKASYNKQPPHHTPISNVASRHEINGSNIQVQCVRRARPLPIPPSGHSNISPMDNSIAQTDESNVESTLLGTENRRPQLYEGSSIQNGTGTVLRANPAYNSVFSSSIEPQDYLHLTSNTSPTYDYPRIVQPAITAEDAITDNSGIYEN